MEALQKWEKWHLELHALKYPRLRWKKLFFLLLKRLNLPDLKLKKSAYFRFSLEEDFKKFEVICENLLKFKSIQHLKYQSIEY